MEHGDYELQTFCALVGVIFTRVNAKQLYFGQMGSFYLQACWLYTKTGNTCFNFSVAWASIKGWCKSEFVFRIYSSDKGPSPNLYSFNDTTTCLWIRSECKVADWLIRYRGIPNHQQLCHCVKLSCWVAVSCCQHACCSVLALLFVVWMFEEEHQVAWKFSDKWNCMYSRIISGHWAFQYSISALH